MHFPILHSFTQSHTQVHTHWFSQITANWPTERYSLTQSFKQDTCMNRYVTRLWLTAAIPFPSLLSLPVDIDFRLYFVYDILDTSDVLDSSWNIHNWLENVFSSKQNAIQPFLNFYEALVILAYIVELHQDEAGSRLSRYSLKNRLCDRIVNPTYLANSLYYSFLFCFDLITYISSTVI